MGGYEVAGPLIVGGLAALAVSSIFRNYHLANIKYQLKRLNDNLESGKSKGLEEITERQEGDEE